MSKATFQIAIFETSGVGRLFHSLIEMPYEHKNCMFTRVSKLLKLHGGHNAWELDLDPVTTDRKVYKAIADGYEIEYRVIFTV